MTFSVRLYVLTVLALASIVFAFVLQLPVGDVSLSATVALSFAVLGVAAHALSYQSTKGALGSIAFIPFLATLSLAPTWIGVLSVTVTVGIVEAMHRRGLTKAVFNVAQQTFAVGLAVLVYRAAGGVDLFTDPSFRPVPQFLMLVVFLMANSAAVAGVISFSERRQFIAVWKANTLKTIVYDYAAFPFIFFFARAYIEFGLAGMFGGSILLLGGRQLYKINWELEKANEELLQLMVAAIEARDPYTSGHSRRVSYYTRIICGAIGMTGKRVERIEIAALLHDVGKIHEIFAPILRKTERMTAEETAVMQTHSIKSAELIANVSHLKDILPAVRHHHERWDGTGYPDRLASEEIPLAARIIMIADTVDAMTSDRPYRKALGESDVRGELVKLRGKQFDPQLCDTLLSSPSFAQLFTTVRRDLIPIGYIPSRLTRADRVSLVS